MNKKTEHQQMGNSSANVDEDNLRSLNMHSSLVGSSTASLIFSLFPNHDPGESLSHARNQGFKRSYSFSDLSDIKKRFANSMNVESSCESSRITEFISRRGITAPKSDEFGEAVPVTEEVGNPSQSGEVDATTRLTKEKVQLDKLDDKGFKRSYSFSDLSDIKKRFANRMNVESPYESSRVAEFTSRKEITAPKSDKFGEAVPVTEEVGNPSQSREVDATTRLRKEKLQLHKLEDKGFKRSYSFSDLSDIKKRFANSMNVESSYESSRVTEFTSRRRITAPKSDEFGEAVPVTEEVENPRQTEEVVGTTRLTKEKLQLDKLEDKGFKRSYSFSDLSDIKKRFANSMNVESSCESSRITEFTSRRGITAPKSDEFGEAVPVTEEVGNPSQSGEVDATTRLTKEKLQLDKLEDKTQSDNLFSSRSVLSLQKDNKQVDRLSHLPEELRVQILSNLPIKCSIRTSLLSKAWYKLYVQSTSLDGTDKDTVYFVHDRLFNPPWTLRNVKLNLTFDEQGDWLIGLNNHRDVEQLELITIHYCFPYEPSTPVPIEVFYKQNLKVLEMDGFRFDQQLRTHGIHTLVLKCILFEDVYQFKGLMKASENLKDLTMIRCLGFQNNLVIESQSLIKLTVESVVSCNPGDLEVQIRTPNLREIIVDDDVEHYIIDCPTEISEASLNLTYPKDAAPTDTTINCVSNFIGSLSQVRRLQLSDKFVIQYNHSIPIFPNLKNLEIMFDDCISKLLKTSPNLESVTFPKFNLRLKKD